MEAVYDVAEQSVGLPVELEAVQVQRVVQAEKEEKEKKAEIQVKREQAAPILLQKSEKFELSIEQIMKDMQSLAKIE